MNRRFFLSNLAAYATLCSMQPAGTAFRREETSIPPPLKSLAARTDMLVGTQAGRAVLQQGSLLSSLIQNNVSIITPGNDMKWTALRPTEDTFHFADADWVVDFCTARGIAVHGHNLCWNTENPAWLDQVSNKGRAEAILRKHIETVCRRYAGKIESWDVVNEPVATWYNRSDGLREGPWLAMLGPAYIDIAFHAAAEADPKAIRVLNLNHVEQPEKSINVSRKKALELIAGMLSRRVPIDAVALESHLDICRPLDLPALHQFVLEIKRMGLQVMITELDVLDSDPSSSIANRDTQVANYYAEYLKELLAVASPKRIIFWSLSDYGNWYDNVPVFRRGDGQKHRPGLFDAHMKPKSAFWSVAEVLQGTYK